MLADGRVLIDCGANIGCTSVYLLNHFPNAKLIAPSVAVFGDSIVQFGGANSLPQLLQYLADNNLHLDAISWHEWNPDAIQGDVASSR